MSHLNKSGSVILLAGLFILFSCAKEPTEFERTPTSTFPLTTDSRWEYAGIKYVVPFHDSSLADTMTLEIYRHIIGRETLGEIIDLAVCDDTVITDTSGAVDTFIHRQWLKLEDNKLKLFAYDKFEIGHTSVPYIFDPPHNLLDFPLSRGKTWIVSTSELDVEERSVAGIDYIELPFGWQYCDVVRGTIRDSATNDTIRSAYEWYSDDGLMRLEYDHGTRIITDELGTFLDTIRTYETWELINMNVQP